MVDWVSKIGKFCVIDYESSNGLKAAIGELISVNDGKLVLKNLNNNEEVEVAIENIKNSRVRDKKEDHHDSN